MIQLSGEEQLMQILRTAEEVLMRSTPGEVELWRKKAREYLNDPNQYETPRDIQMMLYGTSIIAQMLIDAGRGEAYESIVGPIAGLMTEVWQLVCLKAQQALMEDPSWIPREL